MNRRDFNDLINYYAAEIIEAVMVADVYTREQVVSSKLTMFIGDAIDLMKREK